MTKLKPQTRLYIDAPLQSGGTAQLNKAQLHYLQDVMRQKPGSPVLVFNGKDGEWQAELADAELRLLHQTRPQRNGIDLWLLFAPLKKDATDFVIEKATELGASRIIPVITERTNTARVNLDRAMANIIEAAEQCDRLDLPQIGELQKLDAVLSAWADDRILIFADEEARSNAQNWQDKLRALRGKKAAILIGPEGGFSEDERKLLSSKKFTVTIALGPRVLRAETAAIAALSCFQLLVGDWTDHAA